MKALIIAEHAAAAAELVAGARTMADEVVAISFGGAYECGADKVLNITVPEGLTVDSAVETVNAAFDAENPEVVLVEACRHMKVIAGSLAFHADTAVITDVTAFEAAGAKSMYFGGIAERVQKAAGNVAIYTVGAGVFDGAEGANGSVAEQEWVAPARPVKVVSSQVIEKSGVNLFKADVVVAAGRGFAEESQLSLANDLCDKLGIPSRVAPFTVDELLTADEIMILSTGSHCIAVCEVDGRPVGGKAPALLDRLQQAYQQEFLEGTEK